MIGTYRYKFRPPDIFYYNCNVWGLSTEILHELTVTVPRRKILMLQEI